MILKKIFKLLIFSPLVHFEPISRRSFLFVFGRV